MDQNLRAVELLSELGVDANICDENGYTILHEARYCCKFEELKLILTFRLGIWGDGSLYRGRTQIPRDRCYVEVSSERGADTTIQRMLLEI